MKRKHLYTYTCTGYNVKSLHKNIRKNEYENTIWEMINLLFIYLRFESVKYFASVLIGAHEQQRTMSQALCSPQRGSGGKFFFFLVLFAEAASAATVGGAAAAADTMPPNG